MPANLVHNKKEEKYWSESKKIVQKQTGKSKKKLNDQNWGLINKIFQAKKKKHLGKKKKKVALLALLAKIAREVSSIPLSKRASDD